MEMKRRGFLKTLAGLCGVAVAPSIPAVPAARAVQPAPRTVAELERAIEGLYASSEDMAPKAFEEFVFCDGRVISEDWRAYRMVAETWRLVGTSEAELIDLAWKDMRDAAVGFGDATLFWRKRPTITPYNEFDSLGKEFRLYFRMGILPADWKERARGQNELEKLPSWRRKFYAEGAPDRRIG